MQDLLARTPTITQLRPRVLSVLADGRECSIRQICQEVADTLKLDDDVIEARTKYHNRYENRIRWALTGLLHAGLVEKPRRGYYRITVDGRTVEARHLDSYSEKDMLEWSRWQRYQEELAERKRQDAVDDGSSTSEESSQDDAQGEPIELMESAEHDYNAKVEIELRRKLQESDPEFFEHAVLDVLWAIGYGGSQGERRHLGKSGDGGIDGVISQDRLGLNNIYIQAKRYADNKSVGPNEIRDFIGALDANKSTRGIFVTTSHYTEKAKQAASNYHHGTIRLIDGIYLTKLMLEHGIGVQVKQRFVVYEVDEDYFDD